MMKKHTRSYFLLVALTFFSTLSSFAKPTVSGEFKKWHRIDLDFVGPEVSETDAVNPFLDYRMDVEFKNGDTVFYVPGYFAADGHAAESSAKSGNVWRVHFVPNKTGTWTYKVSFVQGKGIAVSDETGDPLAFNGEKGSIKVKESDKPESDFRKKGRVLKGRSNYLLHVDSGDAYLKAGAGSPENFLAFEDFDDTYSLKKEQREGEAYSLSVKTYSNHVQDWNEGDPTWKGGKGKGIIGALNYLAEKGVNSVYFLTMNVYGDGQDVWPWINEHDRTRFDCSKLDQWGIVLNHMQSKGILAHFITQETENELLMDLGNVGTERKLYFRELVARFSHLLALEWNLGEENGWAKWSPNSQNDQQRKDMASYLKKVDPYKNPVVLHTHADMENREKILTEVLGYNDLDGPSFQIDKPSDVHAETIRWRELSLEWERPWMLAVDEIGHYTTGAMPDADDPEHDTIRSQVLWGNLMAGGSGVEWYFGYKYDHNDLKCEDWRTRDILWDQTVAAVNFFQEYLPFQEMEPMDDLTAVEDDYVFIKENEVYCVYMQQFQDTSIDLSHTEGTFSVKWFNPKTGEGLFDGSVKKVMGGSVVHLGSPDAKQNVDWVVLLKKN